MPEEGLLALVVQVVEMPSGDLLSYLGCYKV